MKNLRRKVLATMVLAVLLIGPALVYGGQFVPLECRKSECKSCEGNIICMIFSAPFKMLAHLLGQKTETEIAEPVKQYNITQVTPYVANEMKNSKKVFFVDARTPEEYAKEHIAGAINLPADNPESCWGAFKEVKESDIVICYCLDKCCAEGEKVANYLKNKGYKNVFDLDAGLSGWKENNYPVK